MDSCKQTNLDFSDNQLQEFQTWSHYRTVQSTYTFFSVLFSSFHPLSPRGSVVVGIGVVVVCVVVVCCVVVVVAGRGNRPGNSSQRGMVIKGGSG